MKQDFGETTGAIEDDDCKIHLLWKRKLEHNFNALFVDCIFRNKEKTLIVGHEDGVVRGYPLPALGDDGELTDLKNSVTLETKSGPIQTLVVHDVTKLNNKDLIVADSRGMVTTFSNGQILARQNVSQHCIQCLKIQQDALGHNAIVIGDEQGHVTAFSPFTEHWRVRLADASPYKALDVAPRVTSLHVAELTDSFSQRRSYVLVADSCKHLHFIQGGSIVLTLSTPAIITAMTSGTLLDPESIEGGLHGNSKDGQVALATDTGAIYVMANFQVYQEEICNIHQRITTLDRLAAADTQTTDTLLCAGYFDALCVIRENQVTKYKTPAWISSLVTADVNNDGIQEVVVGCQDNSVHALQINFT